MKTLTKQDVKDASVKLMEANGSTTTLEVKNELRDEGFYATQNQVSDFMNEIEQEELDWEYTNPSGYRVYQIGSIFTSNDDNDTDDTDNTTPASNSGNYVNSDNEEIVPIGQPSSDNWECYSPVSNQNVMYFDGEHSRDEVRCAYRFYTGLHFNETRARRLK